MYFKIVTAIYNKPIAKIIFNDKNLNLPYEIMHKSRQRCSYFSLFFIIVLEILTESIRQQINKQTNTKWKKMLTYPPLADDIKK